MSRVAIEQLRPLGITHPRARDEAVRIADQPVRVWKHIAGLDGMRFGLSRGDAINAGGDYHSTVVNTASRIVGKSFTDAIVATRAVVDALPATVATTPLGDHELRGIREPVELVRIEPVTSWRVEG